MRIVVVGGGPAGLYFSLLAKTRCPKASVQVYEQNQLGATYGFGIVLADRGLSRFRNAHASSHKAIMDASFVSRNRIISHPDESFFVEGGGYGGAVARLRLLQILESYCEKAGVSVEYRKRIEAVEAFSDADLVVGADGVNSALRKQQETAFGTTTYSLTNRLAWYGTTRHFPYPILSFVRSEVGHFVAAAYAYTERMSTFVAECDAATWARSGLCKMGEEEQRKFTESIFANELQGMPLLSNNSAYRSLPVVRNREWSVGKLVLIGDALHSAHPTIGSGTRIAMEDSIALSDALATNRDDIPAALRAFRSFREPQKNKLVLASEKSFQWYEIFPQKIETLKPVDFVFDFLTRTGRISRDRLLAEYPEFMRRYAHRLKVTGNTDVGKHATTAGSA
jgi:2-polyprenyl-6-methoxyphenol hydroxylase-like FAD-dependent oxidoreductase